MNLIQLPTPPPKPAAQSIAEDLLAGLNAEMARRVEHHAREFAKFWDSPETPDVILAAMGPYAILMLQAATENLSNIGKLAAMVGLTLDDAISPQHYMPRREFITTDGVVTLAPPADGFDAWGRPLPDPKPAPAPEPEPEPLP